MNDRRSSEDVVSASYLAVIGSLLLCGATGEALDNVSVSVDGDQVAVTASDVPLRQVLEAIAYNCGLDVRSASALTRRVTLHGIPMPMEELLRRVLRDESYMLLRSDAGKVRSLWIFQSDSGGSGSTHVPNDRELMLDRAITRMSDPDAEVREEAVLSLGDIGGEDVVPLLTQALTDNAAGVREAAAALLEDMRADAGDIE
ncbi:MAG TPA: HEAT repeat domain-containing protein [Woeseiaceae bacterium]